MIFSSNDSPTVSILGSMGLGSCGRRAGIVLRPRFARDLAIAAERVAGVEQQGWALMPGGGTGGGIRFLLPGLGFRTLLFLARQHGIYGLERRRGDRA